MGNTQEDENSKQGKIHEPLKLKYRFNFNSRLTLFFSVVFTTVEMSGEVEPF